MKKQIFTLLIIIILFTLKAEAGVIFNCETAQSGEWRDPSTWINCNNEFPVSAKHAVVINSGHVININGWLSIDSLSMKVNSQISGTSITFNIEGSKFDISKGNIFFNGSFHVTNNGGDIIVGSVISLNNNADVKFISNSDIVLEDTIGGINVEKIQAISLMPSGKIIINTDIITSFYQKYNSPVEIKNTVVLSGSHVEMTKGLSYSNYSIEINIESTVFDSTFSGVINSEPLSELIKSGEGQLVLGENNLIQGVIQLTEGELLFNGELDGNIYIENQSVLKGGGIIHGSIIMNNKSILDPGYYQNGTHYGLFQFNELILNQDSEINLLISGDSVGSDFDQLQISSNIQLTGNLLISVTHEYDYEEIIIINNLSNDPINGSFQGLNEGDIIAENFQISYQGGDGNDVTITSICGKNITVTNNLDNGPGSFRAAVNNVCDDGNIDFEDSYLISVDSTIDIDNSNGGNFLTINGSGQTFISTGDHSVINIVDGSIVSFFGVKFQDSTTNEGAITVHGRLVLNEVYFSNNINTSLSGGGAITNYNSITVDRSSFYQNNANQGGAIHNNDGAVFVRNSTFYKNGNLITNQGGSIYNNRQLELLNVTMVNSGDGSLVEGNSIYNIAIPGITRIINTVIANSNPSLSECSGPPINNFQVSNTLIEDGTCNAPLSGEPLLGDWGDYGGLTPVIPPLIGSPLINSGYDIFCEFLPSNILDQIGNPRTYGSTCDIGSVEIIDVTPPEILELEIAGQFVDVCDVVSEETMQLAIKYNEPVMNSEDSLNYQLLHAGDDQSFLTADDYVVEILTINSDDMHPAPTVTIILENSLTNGLVRLYVDSNITDIFNQQLYDGNNYEIQFRVDQGNLIDGGHFDDCGFADSFPDWQITGGPLTTSEDIDLSNASLSLKKEFDNMDPFSISQCSNISSGVPLIMDAHFKESIGPTNNTESHGNGLFDINMSCIQYDETDCIGNVMGTLSVLETDFSSSNDWVNIKHNLGQAVLPTQSVDCSLQIAPNQSEPYDFYVDKIKLSYIADEIFTNGFD